MMGRPLINFFLTSFVDLMLIEQENEQELEKLRRDWEIARCYPRKKKKAVRKEIELKYSILSSMPKLFRE